jgi:tRNA pseudouridine55 synthase
VNGLLLIDKPQRMTSHDVVARVRRLIGIRAIGHAGTLDPFATGLLILCIGHATRLSEYLIGESKVYTGLMKLGERTNTDDLDGEVIERRPVQVSAQDLARAQAAFTGQLMQVPPQYSAVQIGGQRAYKMARHGETVDLPARPVHVYELALWFDVVCPLYSVGIRVRCSAGTYIRALARDIGETLRCGAHLTVLRRQHSGGFSLDEAVTLEQLQQAAAGGDWQRFLLPMDRAVAHLPPMTLDEAASQRFVQGQWIALPDSSSRQDSAGLCRIYDAGGRFIAVGQIDGATSMLKPVKVFHDRD